MKQESLSHCPDRTDAAVLRVGFETRSRATRDGQSERHIRSPSDPAVGLFARLCISVRRVFTRNAPDDGSPCDVEARLLELETHKLNTQHLGNLRD
ncbi:hypothetical protein LMG29542_03797 [Paraburkholderia humisilvae]|uniref:Uncharacterized protein n=1 Tax=Paraburkholderia humisilvae TaxID=627669 RepID=A0A6J5E1D3_9BURK|nr:hypothetical protein LMG29542_03797 [Paraburkholderia humisilvae]